MRVTIEPLAGDDVERLSSLAAGIWRAHYPHIIGTAQTEYMLAQRYAPAVIRDELAREDLWWDVLRVEGEIRAFAASFLAETASTMKLDKLYVDSAQQRRGYGGMLIETVCGRARRLRCEHVILAVNKRNANAIAAYFRYGFVVRDAVVKPIGGGFVMDDYIMQKDLEPATGFTSAPGPLASGTGDEPDRGRSA